MTYAMYVSVKIMSFLNSFLSTFLTIQKQNEKMVKASKKVCSDYSPCEIIFEVIYHTIEETGGHHG